MSGTAVSGVGSPSIPVDPWESMVPQFDPSAQSGYLGSGELMAWLATVGGNTYDDMRKQMATTEQRGKLQEDLQSIKALIEETKTTEDLQKLEKVMRDLQVEYAGTPFETRVNAFLEERLPDFDAITAAQKELDQANKLPVVAPAGGDDPSNVGPSEVDKAEGKLRAMKDIVFEKLDSWCTDIDAKVDALGKEDQLALIRIQELNSQITQATQLASNILAAQDQAASGVIMNLKV